jgi:hypothetical protein
MTEQAERAKVGDVAKDFVLKDQNEKEFKLSEQKGDRGLRGSDEVSGSKPGDL